MCLIWEEQSGDELVAEDGTVILEEGDVVRATSETSDGDGVAKKSMAGRRTTNPNGRE